MTKPSLGDLFRKGRSDNEEKQRGDSEQKRVAHSQEMCRSLSDFFQEVAKKLPNEVEIMIQKVGRGEHVKPNLSYHENDYHSDRRGQWQEIGEIGTENLMSLTGYKALDDTCKELGVLYSVEVGTQQVNSESMEHYTYIDIRVDVGKSYQKTMPKMG